MKKILATAIFAIALSAGLTLKTQAQTNTVNIENFSTKDNVPVVMQTPYFNNAGELMYVVKRYQAQSLPDNITKLISDKFSDFNISGVEEVSMPAPAKSSVYIVHVENDKSMQTLKIQNNELTVTNKYKKA